MLKCAGLQHLLSVMLAVLFSGVGKTGRTGVSAFTFPHKLGPWTCACEETSANPSRRDFLALGSLILLQPAPASAVGEGSERLIFRQTPSAPLGALLPAVQQRMILEAVRELANGLHKTDVNGDNEKRRLQVESVLLPLDETRKSDYKVMKQHSPSKVLSGALVRASMNIYTANLTYGAAGSDKNPAEVYDVTDLAWKKAYIRANDGLPDVKKLIAADLDLRDLYRNQVQQKLDDASAEWYSSSCDMAEFQGLLKEAASSFDLWLDRIADKDVQEAIQAVLDGKELQLSEPYSAGFIP